MALAKDLSDLPAAAGGSTDGRKPDPSPTFLQPYLDHLIAVNDAEGERPHAIDGTRFRHSMAGGCARAIAFHDLGVPTSNPMDLAGVVVTTNGTSKHDEVQAVLADYFAGFTGPAFHAEVPCRAGDLDGSGSADGQLVTEDDAIICWEHKNVGGFAFKMAVGERGAPQGPKRDHVVQGALNALGMEADLLVVTYLTWEAISVQAAKRKGFDAAGRVAAQWTFTRAEWEPIARAEIERVSKILSCVDAGELPGRVFPDPELPAGHRITDPSTGGWQVLSDDGQVLDAGSWWACGYCRWQDVCAETKPGRQPITEVAVTLGLASQGEAA